MRVRRRRAACRCAPCLTGGGANALRLVDRPHGGRTVRRRRHAVALHRPARRVLGRADAGARRASRAASRTRSATCSASSSADAAGLTGTRAAPAARRRRACRRTAHGVVRLKAGRERSLQQRHPWVFSGAIDRVDGDPARRRDRRRRRRRRRVPRARARIRRRRRFARASGRSTRRRRVDAAFFARPSRRACAARAPMLDARAHGLPARARRIRRVAGRHRRSLRRRRSSCSCCRPAPSAGATRSSRRSSTAPARAASTSARTSTCARSKGCRRASASSRGTLPRAVDIVEAGLHYGVDVVGGQKTGFYLDQRDNRALVGALARGRRVLNAFCYTGGFTLAALAGGARTVLSIDSSADALRSRARTSRATRRSTPRRAEWSRSRRVRGAARVAQRAARVRPDRARSAEVRADGRARASARRAPTRTSTCWR